MMPAADLMDVTYGIAIGGLIVGASMVDVSDPVVVGIGTVVVGGLSGAIKILWDRNNKLSLSTDVALAKCEAEHKAASARVDKLTEQVIDLTSQVSMMKGRIQGFQEASDAAEQRQHEHDINAAKGQHHS